MELIRITGLSYRRYLFFCAIMFCCLLVCVSIFLPDTPLTSGASWSYPDGYDPHGVYLDRVVFIVYPPEDEQLGLQALQAGNIYAWDESLPVASIQELEVTPGVEVSTEPGDFYRMLCLNCGRFPTNITAYRQAMAYALDKFAVIQASTGGIAFPQDCALPLALGNWTLEPLLEDTYYIQDIDKANATLEAAGFRDLDANGWRDFDANNNSILDAGDIIDQDFAIELYHIAGHAPSANAIILATEGLNLCGIMASVASQDFFDMLDLIEVGDYWVSCFIFSDVNSADFLYEMFHSSTENSQWFFGGYNNSVYDLLSENLMAADNEVEANDWAWACQYQLWHDLPMIVCYNDVYTHAYRVDRWEGYINMKTRNRICNGYSLVQIRLKEIAGGPWGVCPPIEYILSLQEGLDTTNWLMSSSDHTDKVFQLIYEGLWTISPYDLSHQPALAYAWEVEPTVASGDIQDGEKYTFHLYQNATWHDGVPVTATDVAFSLDLVLQYSYDAENYQNIYKTVIVNTSTIELYTNATGYFEWERSTGFTVYPAHIWGDVGITGGDIISWVPTVSEVIGSGPYQFYFWVPVQYMVLYPHPDWHFAVERPIDRPPCDGVIDDWWSGQIILLGVIVILVQLCILGFLLYRRSRKGSKNEWSN